MQHLLDYLGVPPTPLYQLLSYTLGPLVPELCLTVATIENAVDVIYSSLPDAPERRFVALDIEWASQLPGAHRVDLIQLAVQQHVFLIRTHLLNELPPRLTQLLGDEDVWKVSAGIAGTRVPFLLSLCGITELIGR